MQFVDDTMILIEMAEEGTTNLKLNLWNDVGPYDPFWQ
jgi:hypothetical protein